MTTAALTVRARIDELLAAPWTLRWSMLAEDADLVDDSVAAACATSDPLLALILAHAADVGVDLARTDFDLARRLHTLTEPAAPIVTEDAVSWALEGVRAVTRESALWLRPLVLQAIERLAGVDAVDRELLSTAYLGVLVFAGGHDMADVQAAFELCRADPRRLWAHVNAAPDVAALHRSVTVAAAHLAVFDSNDGRASAWAAQVRELCAVAMRIGVSRAITQHEMILAADSAADDSAGLRTQSARLVTEYERTASTWLLQPAHRLARIAVDALTTTAASTAADVQAHLRAWLARTIRVCVGAGVLDEGTLDEALQLQREAVGSTGVTAPTRADYRCDLANLISVAVAHSRLEITALRQAAYHGWSAVRADTTSTSRFARLNTASAVIAEAVAAGVAPARLLRRAALFDREAVRLAPIALRPACLGNLGNRIAQALEAGLDGVGTLVESIELRQRAVDETSSTAAAFPGRVNNLSAALARGVLEGAVPAERYRDALDLQRRLSGAAGVSDHERAVVLSNLASRLSDGVSMGLLDTVALGEALQLQTEAGDLIPIGHPLRVNMATNMAGRIADAVDAGIVAADRISEAVAWAREAYVLTPPTHPKLADRAGNLGTAIGRAVALGAEPGRALLEAVAMHREAVTAIRSSGQHAAIHLSNLASRVAEAVDAAQLSRSSLTEAYELQRRAVDMTPMDHPDRGLVVFNLGNRIGQLVGCGMLDAAHLAPALDLHREALRITPPSNTDYVLFAAELGCRVVDAVEHRTLDRADAATELLSLVALLWTALAVESWSPAQRRMHLVATQGFVARAPLVIYHGAGQTQAVAAIETLRNHLLADRTTPSLGAADDLPGRDAEQYRRAAAEYRRSQQLIAENLADPQRCLQLRQRLSEAIERIRAYRPDFAEAPDLTAVRAGLDDRHTALYLLAGPRGGVALPVDHDGLGKPVLLPLLTTARAATAASLTTDAAAASFLAKWLTAAVISPLEAAVDPSRRWLLVPTGVLALLPFHAAGSPQSGWVDDRVELRYAPSVVDTAGEPETAATCAGVSAVSDDADLPFLAADNAAVRRFAPAFTVLDAARRDDVLAAIASAAVVLLGGHSRDVVGGGSALWFTDAALTAEDLARLPRHRRELAVVCSCSGGRVAHSLIDESIGLPHALLRAGFSAVCASLWPVRDLVSFLFTAHLLHQRPTAPSVSWSQRVRVSRRWLRETTGAEMTAFVSEVTTVVRLPFVAQTILNAWSRQLDPNQRVFPDPADWAAFAVYGTSRA